MPSFRFTALDADGRRVDGRIEADDHSGALRLLRENGYKSGQVSRDEPAPSPSQPVPVRPPSPTPAQAPKPAVAQAPKPVPAPSLSPVTPTPVTTPTPGPRGNPRARGSDKDRHLLFSQLAQQFQAGINPVQAFGNTGRMTRTPFRESFLEIANASEKGIRPSEVMQHYPRLYPPQVLGLFRAGEEGGFMAEASSQISQQAFDAHRFRRFHWFVGPSILRFIVLVPGCILAARMFLTWQKMSEEFYGEPSKSLFVRALTKEFAWPVGPLTGIAYVILFLVWLWWKSDAVTMTRHRLGLGLPIYGPRSRNECVNLFCWTLSKLTQVGVSVNRAWEIAISSVPNLVMRKRLAQAGQRMKDGTKLSQVIFDSKLFPEEYAPVVQTGELVGDLPGSLQKLSDASRADYEHATSKAKNQSISFGCTFALVTSGVACIILAYMWYHQLPAQMLEGFEP